MPRKKAAPARYPSNYLLEATLDVIVKGGVDAVRYRNVAKAGKVSLGTVTYYFGSREELIRAALTHYLEESVRELLELRSQFPDPNLHDVADYVVAMLRRNFADPRRRIVAEYELMVYAARDRTVAAALERYENALISELARTLETLGIAAPFAAARMTADLIRGFEVAALGSRSPDFDDFGERLRVALSGFKSHPAEKRGPHASRSPR